MNDGLIDFRRKYEIKPIVLVGGIAQNAAGGILTIDQLLPSDDPDDLDNPFATFLPMPGTTLIDQDIATYPLETQQLAAYATISKPLTVSLRMIAPARPPNGFDHKQAVLLNLQNSLAQHNATGGRFHVATPAFYFVDCLLLSLTDASPPVGETSQAQVLWDWTFMKPLVTLQDIQQTQNNLMSRLTNGSRVDNPAWSGVDNVAGNSQSLAGPALNKNAQNAGAAGVNAPGF